MYPITSNVNIAGLTFFLISGKPVDGIFLSPVISYPRFRLLYAHNDTTKADRDHSSEEHSDHYLRRKSQM